MLIVPELETVLILVPRTGSGSLRRAVCAKYPGAMLIYRHMEADGVPLGYDRWRRVGVVRDPIARLWSLYKFLTRFDGDHDSAYIDAMRRSVARPFSDWLVGNDVTFASPYDRAGWNRYWPNFTVRHPMPENRKSQFMYLRPDLGTHVYRYADYDALCEELGVSVERTHNVTETQPPPVLTEEARAYAEREFAWDFAATREAMAA